MTCSVSSRVRRRSGAACPVRRTERSRVACSRIESRSGIEASRGVVACGGSPTRSCIESRSGIEIRSRISTGLVNTIPGRDQ
mgnify:FL=1